MDDRKGCECGRGPESRGCRGRGCGRWEGSSANYACKACSSADWILLHRPTVCACLCLLCAPLLPPLSNPAVPGVAKIRNGIGNALDRMGKHEEALVELKKALEVLLAVHGQEHHLVAGSYKNIGIVYQHQGNKVEATEMYTKAYRIFHKVRGPDHPDSLGLKPFVKLD